MSLVLGSNRGVNAMLGNQRARTVDFMGKDMMRAFGPAMKGADLAGVTRGVMTSRGLPYGADIAGITRGVVKSQDLLKRAGLRDALTEVNARTGRIAIPSVTSRGSLATAGLLAARTASGTDVMRWTSPGVHAEFARIGAATSFTGVNQQLAQHWQGHAGARIQGLLPAVDAKKLHQVMAAAVAGPNIRVLRGFTGLGLAAVDFSALSRLARSSGWQAPGAKGLTFSDHSAMRELMSAAAIGRSAPSWLSAYSRRSELSRVLRGATRSGFGITGMDVMRGRGIWDGVGAVRAHNALVGVRLPPADYGRLADLFAPGGAWADDDSATPTEAELFVPGPGDILDAVGADIVLADALDGELVPSRRLDIAWEWLCANPGHWVRAWNLVWPNASVHERNTLGRQAATIGVTHLGLAYAWMTGNPLSIIIAVGALGLAWRTLFDELSKLLSEHGE